MIKLTVHVGKIRLHPNNRVEVTQLHSNVDCGHVYHDSVYFSQSRRISSILEYMVQTTQH